MKRSPEEILMRSRAILDDVTRMSLVDKSSTPTAAYDMVYADSGDQNKARAGRWLAILRRDHPEEYQKFFSQHVALLQQDKARGEER
ncbi:MAG: hypothetical protein A2288_00300 [Candidatus Moranbacteria bacterium RIFOXYA12_FULL_44_15]|nr:MAG: hypothetical protein A2288_00300 [Candidatus Moranbacteria bacterium RIFOXYA12_FULL_44_15]